MWLQCEGSAEGPSEVCHGIVKRYENTVLVLKDQHTIICRKDDMYMNTAGNHALAKGGSGDVLCGILTGLYAQEKRRCRQLQPLYMSMPARQMSSYREWMPTAYSRVI